MAKKLVVIMSHQLTDEQIEDAKRSLGVAEVEQLDNQLTQRVRTIPAEWDYKKVQKLAYGIILEAVKANATHISVMGEPALVTACFVEAIRFRLSFVQSTTQRVSQDIPQEDGSTKKVSVFRHVQWRVWQ